MDRTEYYAGYIQAIEEPEKAQHLSGMCRYIDRTPSARIFTAASPYQMTTMDIQVLGELAQVSLFRALYLAFDYGRAKGYRAAKREGGK